MKKVSTLFLLFVMLAVSGLQAQNVKWAKALGNTNTELVTGIAEDANGNTYITGWYATSTSIGSNNFTSKGGNDLFVAKLDTGGNVLWAVSEGGTGDDRGYGVSLDASGNVYICGLFSSNFTYGSGANATSINSLGNTDIFASKYNNNGTFQGIAVAGSTRNDRANALAVDNNGNVIVTGFYGQQAGGGGGGGGGLANATFGAITVNNIGATDAFVASVSSSGSWQWAKGFGNARGQDNSNDVAITANGNNIYITGAFQDSVYFGSKLLISNAGNLDAFIVHLDNTGAVVDAAQGGGTSNDAGNGITVDSKGSVYACGVFAQAGGGGGGGGNTSFTIGSNTLTGTGQEGWIAAYNNSLSLSWAKSYGGANTDALSKISAANGSLFIAGAYLTSTSIGGTSLTSAGASDAFAASLDTAGNTLWAITMGGTATEDARRVLATSSGNQYVVGTFNGTGNSGATGSFGTASLTGLGNSDGYVIRFYTCVGLSAAVSYSGPTNFCQSGSVLMTASTGAASYQWYMNGTAINGANTDTLTATTAGTYYCSMTNSQGCQMNSAVTTINIGTPPSASLSTTGNTICQGDSVLLTANSGNGYKYKLYLNNVAITGFQTSTFFYAKQAGDYTLEVDNFGCTATSSSVTLTVISAPTLAIQAMGSTTFCPGDSVLLSGDTNSTWFYQWQRLVGNTWTIITGANSSDYYAKNNGNHRLMISTSNGCNVVSNIITITTGNLGNVSLRGFPGSGALCFGDSVRLQINTGGGGGGGGAFLYRWMKDGDTLTGINTQIYTIKTSGTYKGVVIFGQCKVATRDTTINFINSSAAVTPGGAVSLCPGDTLNLTAVGDAGSSFQWNLNGSAISGATNNSYRVTQAGNFTCTISLSGCVYRSPATVVTAYNAPTTPTIIQSGNTMASSVQATAYQWYLNNAPIVGAVSQFYYGYSSGFYAVEITDANGCKAKSQLFSFTYINNGINTLEVNKLNLYPNPSTGSFNFFLAGEQDVNIQVYNMEGKQILSNSYRAHTGSQNIDLSGLENGSYIVKVNFGNRYFIDRIQILKQ